MQASWYLPDEPGPFPILVVLPGGRGRGQVGRAWPQYHWCAREMVRRGLGAMVLDYHSDRREPFDVGTIDDILVAVDYAKTHRRVQADALFLLGFSLGGANALRVAGSRSGLAGLITYFAPVDWRVTKTHSPGIVIKQPVEYVAELHSPVLILQGDADEITDVDQARLLESTLREEGKSVELVIYPGAGHGFTFRGAPEGPCCRYNETLALRSFDRVVEFVRRVTRGGASE